MVLKDCFYVGTPLCSLPEFSIFGARAILGMDDCRVSSEGMLTLVSLIGREFGIMVNTSIPGCWANPLFALWMSQPCHGQCAPSCCISPQIWF